MGLWYVLLGHRIGRQVPYPGRAQRLMHGTIIDGESLWREDRIGALLL